jgi:hypothetical protein
MTFEEYCSTKKISSKKFELTEPLLYKEWRDYFEKASPESFTQQKKFLINPVRLKYSL